MKKIKLLLAAVLSVMAGGGVMAEVTQPILTTDVSNPTYYTIKNFRTAKYATYAGASSQLTQEDEISNASLWFFMENGDGVSIIPAADPSMKLASHSSATEEGAVWYLVENPYKEGYFCVSLTNDASANCWDDQTNKTRIGYWRPSGSDFDGTSWTIEYYDVKLETAFATVQSWPFKIQTAEGLVTNGDKWTSNAKDPEEGSYAALVDNDYDTFFHSTWHDSNAPGEDHYLQAELSDAADKFIFYFKKRSQNNNNRPTTIVISASNDGENFTDIQTIANSDEEIILPVGAEPIYYISDEIDLGASYKYLRFTVPTTNSGAKNGGHVYFTFSEFYIYPATQAIKDALDIVKSTTSKDDITDTEAIQELDETLTAQAALKGSRRELNEAIAKAKEIASDEIPAAAYEALQTDIAKYENNNFTTAEEYAAAKEALQVYLDLAAAVLELKNAIQDAESVEVQASYTALSEAIAANDKDYATAEEYAAATEAVRAAISEAGVFLNAVADFNDLAKIIADAQNSFTSEAADLRNAWQAQTEAVKAAKTTADVNAAFTALKEEFGKYAYDCTSYIQNPSPYANANNWTAAEGAPTFDNDQRCAEFWNNSAWTLKQNITLPAGTYLLTVVALQRTDMKGTIEANGQTKIIAQVPASTVNNRTQANEWFNAGHGVNRLLFTVDADDTEVTIGLTTDNTTGDHWTVWRSFELAVVDSEMPLFVAQKNLAAAVATAESHATSLNNKVPEAALTVYNDIIAADKEKNTTVADCLAAIDEIAQATTDVDATRTPFAYNATAIQKAQATIDLKDDAEEDILSAAAQAALQAVVDENADILAACKTAAEVEAQNAAVWAAIGEAITTIELTEGEPLDLTYLLVNPDLTGLGNGKKDGWATDQNAAVQNSQAMTTNTSVANSEDETKYAFYEYWSQASEATEGFTVYQKVTLPEGTYKMEALACAGFGSGHRYGMQTDGEHTAGSISGEGVIDITFSAGDVDGTKIETPTLEAATLDFIQKETGEVKIGLKAHANNQSNWMGIGYVKLYKVATSDAVLVLDEAEENVFEGGVIDIELHKNIAQGWNTIVLPFGVSAEAVSAQFGEGQLYRYTDADLGVLNFTAEEAIVPHTPYLFKAEAANNSVKTFEKVTVSTGTPTTAGTDYNFVGTYSAIAAGNDVITNSDYVLGNGNFIKAQGGNALKAFRAYIQAKEEAPEAVKTLTISLDGVAASIEAIDGNIVSNGAVYNLAGQRVGKAQKGIFIQNGKKVIK